MNEQIEKLIVELAAKLGTTNHGFESHGSRRVGW